MSALDTASVSFASLWRAYRDCRRNKRRSLDALRFEAHLEDQLHSLLDTIQAGTYVPGRSLCFVTHGPKPREVFAASFRDRVVHHLLVNAMDPWFEPRFVAHSFACRKGKGTLAAWNALQKMLRQATSNGKRRVWSLTLDVSHFFNHIRKDILQRFLDRPPFAVDIRELIRTVLWHDPVQDFLWVGKPSERPLIEDECDGSGQQRLFALRVNPDYPVSPKKSLFCAPGKRGLPIGNLTSQFWANVYLNEVDQFIKRGLKVRWYVRYMDDMILLSEQLEQLHQWREQVVGFLGSILHLSVKPNPKEIVPVSQGVRFVGQRVWWNRSHIRQRTVTAARVALSGLERDLVVRNTGQQSTPPGIGVPTKNQDAREEALDTHFREHDSKRSEPSHNGFNPQPEGAFFSVRLDRNAPYQRLEAVFASYWGLLGQSQNRGAMEQILEEFPWLELCFPCHGARFQLRGLNQPIVPARTYARLLPRLEGLPEPLVFRPEGCFYQFYGPQRLLACRVLGLRDYKAKRRDYHLAAGFPTASLRVYLRRALLANCAVLLLQRVRGDDGTRLYQPSAWYGSDANQEKQMISRRNKQQ